jgi:DNA-binding transcriptional MerR regulator
VIGVSEVERLLGTGELAKAVGLSRRTLSRWAAEGRLSPAVVSPGQRARYWWDLVDTRRQLRELRERVSEGDV